MLRNDGNIYGVGSLMLAKFESNTPILLDGWSNIKRIYNVFGKKLLGISFDNKVYVMGSNMNGELGVNNQTNIIVPTVIPNIEDVIEIVTTDTVSYAVTPSGLIKIVNNERTHIF